MATYTLAECYTAVLEDLGVLATGQPASAADTATITLLVQQVLDELEDENLVDWNPSGAIPGDRFLPLVELVAQQAAPKFGKPRDVGAQEMAMRRLRRRAATNSETEPTQASYF